jgi:hypothetical protein
MRPQRHGWAPGGYLCKCHGAGCKDKSFEDAQFIGDKRATMCADCAYALPDPEPEPPFEVLFRAKVADLLRRVRELEIELEKRGEGK